MRKTKKQVKLEEATADTAEEKTTTKKGKRKTSMSSKKAAAAAKLNGTNGSGIAADVTETDLFSSVDDSELSEASEEEHAEVCTGCGVTYEQDGDSLTSAGRTPAFTCETTLFEPEPGIFILHWTCSCGLHHEANVSETILGHVIDNGGGNTEAEACQEELICLNWDPNTGEHVGCGKSYVAIIEAFVAAEATVVEYSHSEYN